MAVGISPLRFGGLLIAGLAVGTCLNVATAISKLGIMRVFRGATPFLIGNVATLILISFFPPLTVWLPALFYR
jgi:TRAP-type transport system large permease protein